LQIKATTSTASGKGGTITNSISWRTAEAADKRDHKKWRDFSISFRWQVQNLCSNVASSSTPTNQWA